MYRNSRKMQRNVPRTVGSGWGTFWQTMAKGGCRAKRGIRTAWCSHHRGRVFLGCWDAIVWRGAPGAWGRAVCGRFWLRAVLDTSSPHERELKLSKTKNKNTETKNKNRKAKTETEKQKQKQKSLTFASTVRADVKIRFLARGLFRVLFGQCGAIIKKLAVMFQIPGC